MNSLVRMWAYGHAYLTQIGADPRLGGRRMQSHVARTLRPPHYNVQRTRGQVVDELKGKIEYFISVYKKNLCAIIMKS